MTDDTDLALAPAYDLLKPLERAFVDAYVSDLQGDAVRAGQRIIDYVKRSKLSNYDFNTKHAAWNARQMMMRPLVQAAIHERIRTLTQAFKVDAENVLLEVRQIAMSNIADYMRFEKDVRTGAMHPVFDVENATREQLSALKRVKIKENLFTGTREVEFELHPKLQALDMLMAYMGMKQPDAASRSPVAANSDAPAITDQTTTSDAADLYARTLRRG